MDETKHYFIPYKQYSSDTYKGVIDICETFGCKYQSFEGLMEQGDAQVYTEEYPDAKEVRVWSPDPEDLVHKSTDCKLTLLWVSNEDYEVQANELAFQNFVFGRKLVYYDTFRKKYYSLLMQKQPSKGKEKLYGGIQYRQVTYTFTNLTGSYYDENPLK